MFSLKVDDDLELALPDEEGLEESYSLIMANYDHVREWSHWLGEDFSLDKARAFFERNIRNFENGTEITLRIIYQGKAAGSVELFHIDNRNKTAEIGYWLAKDRMGKGLMTRSVKRVMEHAFGELALNRIVMKCVPENVKSRAIPEKLGLTSEGIERQSGWLHTRFVDHVVYSMLKDDWERRFINEGNTDR